MTERRGRWPAVGLGLQVMGGEFQPRILHLNETGTSVARYLVLFAAALLPLTVAVVRSRTLLTTLRRPPLTWWCVYLSWICIATVWSIDPTHALQPALWIVSVSLYTSWYVSTAGWEAFELTVARSGVAFIVVGAIVEPIGGLGNGRLQGLMLAPTTMGRLGAVVGIIGVSVWSRGRAHRLLGAVAVITGLYAILASSTRTAAVALLVIGGWAFVRRTGRSGALAVTFVALSLIAVFMIAADNGIVIVNHTPDGTDFAQQRNGILVLQHTPGENEYATGTGRTSVWRAALYEVVERPVFGWGTGSSDRLFQELAAQGRINWIAVTAHDTPLQILLEQGAIGLGLFLVVLASWRRAARGRTSTVHAALALFLLVGGLGESLLDTGRVSLLVFAALITVAADDAATSDRRPSVVGADDETRRARPVLQAK